MTELRNPAAMFTVKAFCSGVKGGLDVASHTSHVTRHTSHVTCTTEMSLDSLFRRSPVRCASNHAASCCVMDCSRPRHTSHVTRHTSHVARRATWNSLLRIVAESRSPAMVNSEERATMSRDCSANVRGSGL